MRRLIRPSIWNTSLAGAVLLLTLGMPRSGLGGALRVLDDTGHVVTLARPAQRIASLSPGATEMLFAAGAGDRVVATVAYADEPAAASRVPRIGDSEAIDLERLILLRPDVVVMWPAGNSAPQLARLRGMGLPLYGQQVDRLADLAPALRRLGVLTGRSASAELAATRVEQQLAMLRSRFASQTPLSVLLQVWSHPVYTIGGRQLLTDVLGVCGARNVFGDLPEAGPAVSIEAVLARDPQVIVAAGPGEAAARWLGEWRAYPTLSAVRSQNLIAFPDPRLTRLGPSVLPAAAELCEALGRARASQLR